MCVVFFCRHGDRCSRLHTKPTISQTVLLVNIYQSPELTVANDPEAAARLDPRKVQEHFEVGVRKMKSTERSMFPERSLNVH